MINFTDWLGGNRFHVYDYEEVTIDATAGGVALTAAKYADARFAGAYVFYSSGPVNVRVDGTAPTSSVGNPRYDLDTEPLNITEATKWRAIRQGNTSGTARVNYCRRV